ncbi:M81 family metallopeptidase [Defluviimonas sp. WL0050]|uniref:M81 family metallopeptidase n=1 Tax=Albidovulum litorale TaxID=2984134 RepID=A0ABT2ZU76_9RHOB|nr:M81 family metallopeptidase [Defluviimonas sp. WL0050]MCV2874582.1 M81 family metallopeptidase [Defluviimonas sp. WL0050]
MKRRTFNTLAAFTGIAAISSPSLASTKKSGKLRVCCVGFFHETNTYLTEGMGETTLDNMRIFRGDEIKALRGTALGGAVDVCEENGWDLLPGLIYGPDSSWNASSD